MTNPKYMLNSFMQIIIIHCAISSLGSQNSITAPLTPHAIPKMDTTKNNDNILVYLENRNIAFNLLTI